MENNNIIPGKALHVIKSLIHANPQLHDYKVFIKYDEQLYALTDAWEDEDNESVTIISSGKKEKAMSVSDFISLVQGIYQTIPLTMAPADDIDKDDKNQMLEWKMMTGVITDTNSKRLILLAK